MSDNLEDLKIEYCRLMRRDEQVFEQLRAGEVSEGQTAKEQAAIATAREEIVRRYQRAGGPVATVSFHGSLADVEGEVNHDDIDQSIRRAFPENQAWPNSESGTFFCDCTAEVAESLERFLAGQFPALELERSEIDEKDRVIPGLNSWDRARAYLDSNIN